MDDTMGQEASKPFRYIREGEGATLYFDQESLTHVGTDGCQTCVGVYLPINDSFDAQAPTWAGARCFVAHVLSPMVLRDTMSHTYCVPTTAGEDIKRRVLDKLNAESSLEGWSWDQVDQGGMIIVCPRYHTSPERDSISKYFSSGGRMTGCWVVQAIKEFLRMSVDPEVDDSSEGFVVDHSGNDKVVRIDAQTAAEMVEFGWYEGHGVMRYIRQQQVAGSWRFNHTESDSDRR